MDAVDQGRKEYIISFPLLRIIPRTTSIQTRTIKYLTNQNSQRTIIIIWIQNIHQRKATVFGPMFHRQAREIAPVEEEGEMREAVMKKEIKRMEEMLLDNYLIRMPVIHHLLMIECAIINFKQDNQSMNNLRGRGRVKNRESENVTRREGLIIMIII